LPPDLARIAMSDTVDVRTDVISGFKWSAASQFGRQGIQFLVTIVLAHLLSPTDFGLVGMAMVAVNFVATFKDLGTAAAVIQRKDLSERLLSSIFWANSAFGLAATIGLFLVAPLAAAFYHQPRVAPLLGWLSITFLISGLTIVQQALLQRRLAFQTLARMEIAAIMAGGVVGIGAAVLGAGVWSLVYQTLTTAAATTVLLWISCPWRPALVFSWSDLRSVQSYSLNLTGFAILNYFSRNIDHLIIGKFLGAQPLGYYTLAYRLMLYPSYTVSAVVSRVMFPVYAKLQDEDSIFRQAYLKVAGATAILTFPLMLGLMALSRPFIVSVFGPKWEAAAVLVILLAPVGLMQSIGTMNGSIYAAKGRTDLQLRVGAVFTVITTLSFVIGIRWEITGVAAAYALACAAITYPSFAIPLGLIGLRVRDLWRPLSRPLGAGLLMTAVALGLNAGLSPVRGTWPVLAISSCAAGLVYALAAWRVDREHVSELLTILRPLPVSRSPADD